jgi:hypothetical protein
MVADWYLEREPLGLIPADDVHRLLSSGTTQHCGPDSMSDIMSSKQVTFHNRTIYRGL